MDVKLIGIEVFQLPLLPWNKQTILQQAHNNFMVVVDTSIYEVHWLYSNQFPKT